MLALLAMPAWARDDSLARLQKQHAALCETTRERLGHLRRMREVYPNASDRDLALAQWQAVLEETHVFYPKDTQIRGEHRAMLKTLTSAAITRAFSGAFHKTYKPDLGSAKIFTDEGAADVMRIESDLLGDAIEVEAEAFQKAVKDRQDYRRLRSYILWGLLGAAARAERRRFSALTDALQELDAAKRRYGIAARTAVASAVVSSARKEMFARPAYESSMSLLDREVAIGVHSKELAIRSVAAHQAFVKALKAERGRRRRRAAAGGLGALFLAGGVGAWSWFRRKPSPVPPPPSRPTPRKLPPRPGPGRLE